MDGYRLKNMDVCEPKLKISKEYKILIFPSHHVVMDFFVVCIPFTFRS